MPGAVLSIAGNSPEAWPVPRTASLAYGGSALAKLKDVTCEACL